MLLPVLNENQQLPIFLCLNVRMTESLIPEIHKGNDWPIILSNNLLYVYNFYYRLDAYSIDLNHSGAFDIGSHIDPLLLSQICTVFNIPDLCSI